MFISEYRCYSRVHHNLAVQKLSIAALDHVTRCPITLYDLLISSISSLSPKSSSVRTSDGIIWPVLRDRVIDDDVACDIEVHTVHTRSVLTTSTILLGPRCKGHGEKIGNLASLVLPLEST